MADLSAFLILAQIVIFVSAETPEKVLNETSMGECFTSDGAVRWTGPYFGLKILPDVASMEECEAECFKQRGWCTRFTWFSKVEGQENICQIQRTDSGVSVPCQHCESKTRVDIPVRQFSGACKVQQDSRVSAIDKYNGSAEDCARSCIDSFTCRYYTWYEEGSELENICLMFTACNEIVPCTNCASGQVTACVP